MLLKYNFHNFTQKITVSKFHIYIYIHKILETCVEKRKKIYFIFSYKGKQ